MGGVSVALLDSFDLTIRGAFPILTGFGSNHPDRN